MPQLPLFTDAPHPTSRSIARSTPHPKPESPRPTTHRVKQIAPVARLPQCSIVPESEVTPAGSIAIAPSPAKKLPPGWVDPADPNFNYLRNCRLCGALIKTGGLDHSLCSGDCGWVVDLQWLAWMEAHRRKRKEPEPQAPTHTDRGESEALDLFGYGIDRDTSEMDGGAA